MPFDALRRQFLRVVSGASVFKGYRGLRKERNPWEKFPAVDSATPGKWSRW